MKLRWIVLVVVALTAIGLVLFYKPAQEAVGLVSYPTLPKEETQLYDAFTLVYQDPLVGFSVRYPKGYIAESDEGAAFLFYTPTPAGFSESFLIKTLNVTITVQELQSLLTQDFPNLRKISESTLLVNQKKTPRLQYVVPGEKATEDLHVIQAMVPCNSYSLYYLAIIPDSVNEDLALADYVLYSLSC